MSTSPRRRISVLSQHLCASAAQPLVIYGWEHGDVVGLAPGAADISPFVNKVITFCEFAGIPYTLESIFDSAGDKMDLPKGKAPFIQHEGQTIADSYFILKYLQREFPQAAALDAHLTPTQKAIGQAVTRQCEEWLFWGCYLMPRFITAPEQQVFFDLYFEPGSDKSNGKSRRYLNPNQMT